MIEYKPGFRDTVTLATQRVVWIRCGFRAPVTLVTQGVVWIRCGFRVTVTLATQGVVWIRCGFSYCNPSYSRGGVNQMWMLICLSIYWRYSNGNQLCTSSCRNRIGGIMVSVLASIAVYRGFEPRSGQTKDYIHVYTIGSCWLSAKHAALRSKSKDCFARNQNNVFEWSGMSIHGLLFQWASTIKIQLSILV
jgi:hypothetical protein